MSSVVLAQLLDASPDKKKEMGWGGGKNHALFQHDSDRKIGISYMNMGYLCGIFLCLILKIFLN